MNAGELENVVLEGVFLPTGWAAAGEVVDVSLMTFDEKDYPIDAAIARDRTIQRLIRQHVRVSAVVRDSRVVAITHIAAINRED